MRDVRHCADRTTLCKMVLGQLPDEDIAVLKRHVQQCSSCREFVSSVRAPEPVAAGAAMQQAPQPAKNSPWQAAPARKGGPCPRCGAERNSIVKDWCQACGYCGEEDLPAPAPANKYRVPTWMRSLAIGILVIVALSVLMHILLGMKLTRTPQRMRAWIGTIEFGIGLVLLIVAQVWAVLVILPSNREYRLSMFNMVIPVSLWINACKFLPETRKPVTMGSWCLTALLSGLFIVGGQAYWFKRMVIAEPKAGGPGFVATIAKGKDMTLEEAMEEFTDNVEVELAEEDLEPEEMDEEFDTDAAPPTRFETECLVLGYLVDGDGKVVGLVLGAQRDGQVKFAGTVGIGADPGAKEEATQWMAGSKIRSRPAVEAGDLKAVWVEPKNTCHVEYGSMNAAGVLQEPAFKTWSKLTPTEPGAAK